MVRYHGNHTEYNMPNNLINLIYGGSFEEASPPTGMFVNIGTPTAVARDTGDRDGHGGAYAVKITSNGSGNEGIKTTLSDLKASTKYTVRVRAKATAGDTARIWTTGGDTNLDEEATSTSWVDLIGFFETDSTPTAVVLNLGSDNATDIVWFDMLIVVEGQGAFTWTPYPGEILATAWDDIRVPANMAKRIGNADPDWEVFLNGVYGLAFSASVDQEIFFTVQIPHSWKLGTNLHPHIHWAPSDTDTGSVTWKMEYTIANINGTFGATATLDVTDAGDGTAHKHQYADLGDIDMSSYTADTDVSITLLCRLYRDIDDGDDYTSDAFLLEIDFHFEIDTNGSTEELTK
jgi:hypothetical protein